MILLNQSNGFGDVAVPQTSRTADVIIVGREQKSIASLSAYDVLRYARNKTNASVLTFDQWNYYWTELTSQGGVAPESVGFNYPRDTLLTVDEWWGYTHGNPPQQIMTIVEAEQEAAREREEQLRLEAELEAERVRQEQLAIEQAKEAARLQAEAEAKRQAELEEQQRVSNAAAEEVMTVDGQLCTFEPCGTVVPGIEEKEDVAVATNEEGVVEESGNSFLDAIKDFEMPAILKEEAIEGVPNWVLAASGVVLLLVMRDK